MKQTIDGITVSDNQQVDAIERAIHFYLDKHPKHVTPATYKFHLAALAAAAKTIRDIKDKS